VRRVKNNRKYMVRGEAEEQYINVFRDSLTDNFDGWI